MGSIKNKNNLGINRLGYLNYKSNIEININLYNLF